MERPTFGKTDEEWWDTFYKYTIDDTYHVSMLLDGDYPIAVGIFIKNNIMPEMIFYKNVNNDWLQAFAIVEDFLKHKTRNYRAGELTTGGNDDRD